MYYVHIQDVLWWDFKSLQKLWTMFTRLANKNNRSFQLFTLQMLYRWNKARWINRCLEKFILFCFFGGMFDAREDTAVRVSSRRTVVPNYLNSLVHGQVKLTSWNGEETRKCLSGSVSRFDSLKVEHIGKSSNYFYNCRHFMGFTADWHCE